MPSGYLIVSTQKIVILILLSLHNVDSGSPESLIADGYIIRTALQGGRNLLIMAD
jgi:hypothetical protein